MTATTTYFIDPAFEAKRTATPAAWLDYVLSPRTQALAKRIRTELLRRKLAASWVQ